MLNDSKPGGLFDFLERNTAMARRSDSAWGTHKVGFGPFTRWLTFSWHVSIGAKYWLVHTYQDAVEIGQAHLEAGEDHVSQS